MSLRNTNLPALAIVSLLALTPVLLLGCQPKAETEESGSDEPAAGSSTTQTGTEGEEEEIAVVESSGESLEEALEEEGPLVLGDPELFDGIPGEGPLTLEQAQAFFDDPTNHEVIDPVLPFGLDAAKASITSCDTNPLTKAKIELGRQLYFDTRMSGDNTISCATCHDPNQGYTTQTPTSTGIAGQLGGRNAPVSFNRILSEAQFWDGRAASVEEQAKGPIENPIEHGFTHDDAVYAVSQSDVYQYEFEKVFGEEGITIDTIAQAIAAFERALVTGPAPYDYYEFVRSVEESYTAEDMEYLPEEDPELWAKYQSMLAGAEDMSESARRGRELFFSAEVGCTACHSGANFSDEMYHNIGVGMDVEEPDPGRFIVSEEEAETGAYKTPTLRNIALSGPYMHDGSQETLMEVVEWYAQGGHDNPHLSDKIKAFEATEQEKADLVAFMEALTGDLPPVEEGRLPE